MTCMAQWPFQEGMLSRCVVRRASCSLNGPMIGLRGKNFRRVRRWSHQPPGPNNFEQSWQGQWEEQRVRSWIVGIAPVEFESKCFHLRSIFPLQSRKFSMFVTKMRNWIHQRKLQRCLENWRVVFGTSYVSARPEVLGELQIYHMNINCLLRCKTPTHLEMHFSTCTSGQ